MKTLFTTLVALVLPFGMVSGGYFGFGEDDEAAEVIEEANMEEEVMMEEADESMMEEAEDSMMEEADESMMEEADDSMMEEAEDTMEEAEEAVHHMHGM